MNIPYSAFDPSLNEIIRRVTKKWEMDAPIYKEISDLHGENALRGEHSKIIERLMYSTAKSKKDISNFKQQMIQEDITVRLNNARIIKLMDQIKPLDGLESMIDIVNEMKG